MDRLDGLVIAATAAGLTGFFAAKAASSLGFCFASTVSETDHLTYRGAPSPGSMRRGRRRQSIQRQAFHDRL